MPGERGRPRPRALVKTILFQMPPSDCRQFRLPVKVRLLLACSSRQMPTRGRVPIGRFRGWASLPMQVETRHLVWVDAARECSVKRTRAEGAADFSVRLMPQILTVCGRPQGSTHRAAAPISSPLCPPIVLSTWNGRHPSRRATLPSAGQQGLQYRNVIRHTPPPCGRALTCRYVRSRDTRDTSA